MPLKPWYKVVTPREDLREGRPLDAAEFAVHLDDVRNNCAPPDYQKPDRFFARTYLTKNLSTLASEVIRRLSGQRTETSAVLNLASQFGEKDARLFTVAQTPSVLYAASTDEKRWVDGVLARKKGLGF